jgi:hypothetical protein
MSRRDRDILVEAGYFRKQGKENPMRELNDHELDLIAAGASNGNGHGHGRGRDKKIVIGVGTVGTTVGNSVGVNYGSVTNTNNFYDKVKIYGVTA